MVSKAIKRTHFEFNFVFFSNLYDVITCDVTNRMILFSTTYLEDGKLKGLLKQIGQLELLLN